MLGITATTDVVIPQSRSTAFAAAAVERLTKASASSDIANAQVRLQSAKAELAEAEANRVQIRQDSARTITLRSTHAFKVLLLKDAGLLQFGPTCCIFLYSPSS